MRYTLAYEDIVIRAGAVIPSRILMENKNVNHMKSLYHRFFSDFDDVLESPQEHSDKFSGPVSKLAQNRCYRPRIFFPEISKS